MMNQRTTACAFVALLLGLALTPLVHAGMVSQTSFVKTAILKKAAVARQRSHLEVLLDLSGYRDATVSFDFAALMRRDAAGFKVSSAPKPLHGDIRLVSPIASRLDRGPARLRARRMARGFSRTDSGPRYSTAMFNLAAYDGQTVLLTLEFERRAAQRRGTVNINNLKIAVAAADTGPAGAAIPEPAVAWLLVAGALGLLLAPRQLHAAGSGTLLRPNPL